MSTDANEQWIRALDNLMSQGHGHSPRGMRTSEILNYSSAVDMTSPVVTIRSRKLNYRFMCAEAYWILSGSNSAADITPYCKNIGKFSDDGYRFQGAYGPRVTEQLRYVCDTLAEDYCSRQAVIGIWREQPRKSLDIPCTLTLQFLLRDGKLHCIANMRSSDIWLGWPYDVFNFSMISAWVALRLNEITKQAFELGTLYLNAGSQHLYDRNMEEVAKCQRDSDAWSYRPMSLINFNGPASLMSYLKNLRDSSISVEEPFLCELRENYA